MNHHLSAMFLLVPIAVSISSQVNAQPELNSTTYHDHNNEIQIQGSSFGPGPHVVFFENFEKGRKFSDSLSIRSNKWFDDIVLYKESSGNHAHRAKDPNMAAKGQKGMAQIIINFQKHYSEALISYSVRIPEGTTFPGASKPKTFPDPSSWKFTWLMSGEDGFGPGKGFDVCLPTHVGNGNFSLGGNDGTVTWLEHGSRWWDWEDYNHMTSYIKFDALLPLDPVEYSWSVTNSKTMLEKSGTILTSAFNSNNREFDRINIPGWWGNGDNSRFDGLYDNLYIAVGDYALARGVITDNERFSQSKVAITVATKSWSNDQIILDADVIPSDRAYYLHIFDHKGQRSLNSIKICPRCPKMVQQ